MNIKQKLQTLVGKSVNISISGYEAEEHTGVILNNKGRLFYFKTAGQRDYFFEPERVHDVNGNKITIMSAKKVK